MPFWDFPQGVKPTAVAHLLGEIQSLLNIQAQMQSTTSYMKRDCATSVTLGRCRSIPSHRASLCNAVPCNRSARLNCTKWMSCEIHPVRKTLPVGKVQPPLLFSLSLYHFGTSTVWTNLSHQLGAQCCPCLLSVIYSYKLCHQG